jgi:hypothetical protein
MPSCLSTTQFLHDFVQDLLAGKQRCFATIQSCQATSKFSQLVLGQFTVINGLAEIFNQLFSIPCAESFCLSQNLFLGH